MYCLPQNFFTIQNPDIFARIAAIAMATRKANIASPIARLFDLIG
jgi:hypothetical protein